MDEILALYEEGRRKKERKMISSVFFFLSEASSHQPLRNEVQSSRRQAHKSGFTSLQNPLNLSNEERTSAQSSVFTLRTKKKQTNKQTNKEKQQQPFAQTRPLFPLDCRAAARRCLRLLTLVGSYDVRIGWVSSSELKHCGKHTAQLVCVHPLSPPLSVHENRAVNGGFSKSEIVVWKAAPLLLSHSLHPLSTFPSLLHFYWLLMDMGIT